MGSLPWRRGMGVKRRPWMSKGVGGSIRWGMSVATKESLTLAWRSKMCLWCGWALVQAAEEQPLGGTRAEVPVPRKMKRMGLDWAGLRGGPVGGAVGAGSVGFGWKGERVRR